MEQIKDSVGTIIGTWAFWIGVAVFLFLFGRYAWKHFYGKKKK